VRWTDLDVGMLGTLKAFDGYVRPRNKEAGNAIVLGADNTR
jgi:hypothetical protein